MILVAARPNRSLQCLVEVWEGHPTVPADRVNVDRHAVASCWLTLLQVGWAWKARLSVEEGGSVARQHLNAVDAYRDARCQMQK